MMTVRGHCGDVTATGDLDPGNASAASVDLTINTESIKTNNEYETTIFGHLTIKGSTRPVSLKVSRYGKLNDALTGLEFGVIT